jgi:hypothetical protein
MKKALIISLSLLNFVACSRNHYKDVKVDGYYNEGNKSVVDIHDSKMTMYEYTRDMTKYKVTTADVSVSGRKVTFKNFKSECDNNLIDSPDVLVTKHDGVLKIKDESIVSGNNMLTYKEIDEHSAKEFIEYLKSTEMDCSVEELNAKLGKIYDFKEEDRN